jgi:hypothetical protein
VVRGCWCCRSPNRPRTPETRQPRHLNPSLDSSPTGDCEVGGISASVTIGEFSRLTHLTVKSLRHYHNQGSGLAMPLVEVRRVLESADPGERDG